MKSLAIAGLALVSVAALAGCTKPAPAASVVTGTTTLNTEAICWNEAGVDPNACGQTIVNLGDALPTLTFIPGDTIGISVDKSVADLGWYPAIGTPGSSEGVKQLTSEPLHTTYYRFQVPSLTTLPSTGVNLTIQAGTDNVLKGVWMYKIVPAY